MFHQLGPKARSVLPFLQSGYRAVQSLLNGSYMPSQKLEILTRQFRAPEKLWTKTEGGWAPFLLLSYFCRQRAKRVAKLTEGSNPKRERTTFSIDTRVKAESSHTHLFWVLIFCIFNCVGVWQRFIRTILPRLFKILILGGNWPILKGRYPPDAAIPPSRTMKCWIKNDHLWFGRQGWWMIEPCAPFATQSSFRVSAFRWYQQRNAGV
jgi:hypothetical protein